MCFVVNTRTNAEESPINLRRAVRGPHHESVCTQRGVEGAPPHFIAHHRPMPARATRSHPCKPRMRERVTCRGTACRVELQQCLEEGTKAIVRFIAGEQFGEIVCAGSSTYAPNRQTGVSAAGNRRCRRRQLPPMPPPASEDVLAPGLASSRHGRRRRRRRRCRRAPLPPPLPPAQ